MNIFLNTKTIKAKKEMLDIMKIYYEENYKNNSY